MSNESKQEDVALQSNMWWLLLIQGIAAVIIGWLLLVSPVRTVLSLVYFLGFYWLITGMVEVVMSFFSIGKEGSKWGWTLFGGIIGIIAGLFVLNNPIFAGIFTPVMLMYIVAFTFVINGVVKMVVGKQEREEGKFDWSWGSFFLGLFYLIFGIMLISSPVLLSTASLLFAGAFLAIIGGISAIVMSFKVKGADKKANKSESK